MFWLPAFKAWSVITESAVQTVAQLNCFCSKQLSCFSSPHQLGVLWLCSLYSRPAAMPVRLRHRTIESLLPDRCTAHAGTLTK